MLSTGTLLQGRYVVQRVLGKGGMGAVYLARECRLEKLVAIKALSFHAVSPQDREKAVKQFEIEARILAGLAHPGLVCVSDYFEDSDSHYLVMEYVEGSTLDAVLNKRQGHIEVPLVMGWTRQICDVLEYLHHQDPPVLFRDLKPSNIMLDSHGRIRLIDFGIARIFDKCRTATFIKGAGTPGFAPIEQYGVGTDPRADIYALGATVYSLLTKTVPPPALERLGGQKTLIPAHQINTAVSAELDAILRKMMEINRENRYRSVSEVREALHELYAPPDSSKSDPTATTMVGVRRCSICGTVVPADRSCLACHTRETAPPVQVQVSAPPARSSGPLASPTTRPRRTMSVWLPRLLVISMTALIVGMTQYNNSQAAVDEPPGPPAMQYVQLNDVFVSEARAHCGLVVYHVEDEFGTRYEVRSPRSTRLEVGARYKWLKARCARHGKRLVLVQPTPSAGLPHTAGTAVRPQASPRKKRIY